MHRPLRINGVTQCLYSADTARERVGLYPARPFCRAHSFGPFRPRPGRPSAHRTMPVFVGVWESKVSQPLCRQSPPSPPRQTASPATLHCVPRPWSLGDSETGIRISARADAHDITRYTGPPQRLPATKANQGNHAPASVLMPASYPARRIRTRIYFYHKGAAADAAAALLLEGVKERVPRVPLY